MKEPTDQELLDFLETRSDGTRWACHDSTTGRGYRLHAMPLKEAVELEAQGIPTFPSARQALKNAYWKWIGDPRGR